MVEDDLAVEVFQTGHGLLVARDTFVASCEADVLMNASLREQGTGLGDRVGQDVHVGLVVVEVQTRPGP